MQDDDEFRFGIWWLPDGDRLRTATGSECAVEIRRLRAQITILQNELAECENDLGRERANNFALAANQCHAGYGDERGNHRWRYQDEMERLNAETDASNARKVALIKTLKALRGRQSQ